MTHYYKDKDNKLHVLDDPAFIGLFPESGAPYTEIDETEYNALVVEQNSVHTHTYPEKTITLSFLDPENPRYTKTLPARTFVKSTLEQALVDKVTAIKTDIVTLLYVTDLVTKDAYPLGSAGYKYGIKNAAYVTYLRALNNATPTPTLTSLTTVDEVLAYVPDLAPQTFVADTVIITFNQFVQALKTTDPAFITTLEASDFVTTRTIPAALLAVVAALPTEDHEAAILKLQTMTELSRKDAFVLAWEQIYATANSISLEASRAILDSFFLTAFEL